MTPFRKHVAKWSECQACPLGKQRFRICLARGQVPCDVLFVGEAPGPTENVRGQPFVGPAGRLLDDIVDRAGLPETGLRWAFTNVVACFPAEAKKTPDHRPPEEAVRACAPRLREFVEEVAKPRLIVCVGDLAGESVPLAVDAAGPVEIIRIPHPAWIMRLPAPQQPIEERRAAGRVAEALRAMGGRRA